MKKILLISFIALGVGISAQVTGSKTIGTDYPTLASAFADLNTNGVGTGGVTLNIPAGYAETAPTGGYILGSIVLNASLSETNPLTIQKSGSGLNPIFTGNTGTTTNLDAIFKFSGVDYMMLDGIDLKENTANTTPTTLNERGFAFYVLNATDGCNYNTIKNSTITFLKTVNNNAIGIYFGHTAATSTAIITPTSTAGSHSFNKIYGNTIVKALNAAINFTGYLAPSPYTLYDQGNDIGGNTSATGNTITDMGGISGGGYITTNYGINSTNQNNANISNNTINFSPDGKGTIGIYASGPNCTYTTNTNIINAIGQSDGDFGSQHAGISTSGSGLTLTANNNILNVSATIFAVGGFGTATYGIWSVSTGGVGNISASGNTITVSGNDVSYGLYSNVTGGSVNITNNTIRNIFASSTSGYVSGLHLINTGIIATNVSGNKISNITSNGSAGTAYGLFIGGTAASTSNIFNNLIGDIKTPISTATAAATAFRLAGIYLAASGANSKLNVYYNTVNLNASSSGDNFSSTGIYHTYNVTPTSAALDMRNNMIVNTSTPTGAGTACAIRRNSAADLSNYAASSNNNDFAVGSAGFVYSQGTTGTTKYDFAAFKALVVSRETNSISAVPQFVSNTGTDADFLKLNGAASANATIDNKGASITGYPTDFAGITRDTNTPDLGGYEFTYADPTLALSDLNKTKMSVYPNPFTDILRISDVKDVKSVSINDMTGRQVKSMAPSSEINLGNLNAGLYIVNVQLNDGSVKSFKVIKK